MKKILLTSAAIALASTLQAQFSIDFQTGYVDGNIAGQDGWGSGFGSSLVVDTTAGALTYPVDNGPTQYARTISDAEFGTTFDDAASIIDYTFNLSVPTPSPTTLGASIYFGIGDGTWTNTQELGFLVYDNGYVQIKDGTTNWNLDYIGGAAGATGSGSFTLRVDFGNDSFSVLNNTIGGPSITNQTFVRGTTGTGAQDIYLTTGSAPTTAQLTEISISAVPEPSTYVLVGGMLALGVVMFRRRRAA
jgi:hypothetical protein